MFDKDDFMIDQFMHQTHPPLASIISNHISIVPGQIMRDKVPQEV